MAIQSPSGNVVPLNYKPACADCPFFHLLQAGEGERPGVGECRVLPPRLYLLPGPVAPAVNLAVPKGAQPQQMSVNVTPMVPRVTTDYWCGNHPYFDELNAGPDEAA